MTPEIDLTILVSLGVFVAIVLFIAGWWITK